MTQQKAEPGSVEQKISDLYKMGLDSVRLNAEGAARSRPPSTEFSPSATARS